jgi:Holliday junction resolvase RusA-like endonuclease
MIKMMKDCMTRLGYWHDDAQVCSEIVEKFYDVHEGVYVRVDKL